MLFNIKPSLKYNTKQFIFKTWSWHCTTKSA